MPSHTSAAHHPRRVLHSAILWLARRLLGNGSIYRGKIEVTIRAPHEGEKVVLVPVKGTDGLTEPESYGSNSEAINTSQQELLRVMFSRDEVRILSEMVGKSAAMKASAVLDACRVEKSKFWVLWSNLQQRGFIGDAEKGEGFVLLVDWVRQHLQTKKDEPSGVRNSIGLESDADKPAD